MRTFSAGEARRNASYEAEAKSLERDLAMVRPRQFRWKPGLGQDARIQSERTRHRRVALYEAAISRSVDDRAPTGPARRETPNPCRKHHAKPLDDSGQEACRTRGRPTKRARRGFAASRRASTR